MPRLNRSQARRRGAIAPLTAVLSLFLVGMVAFAVDFSWIVLTKSELQNVADAAALAGANKLTDNYVLYNLPNQTTEEKSALLSAAITSARTTAKQYAALNGAGGVSSITLRDEDVEVGFMDKGGTFTPLTNGGTTYPNSVRVVARRDDQANDKLGLYFAPALGTGSIGLTASAQATVYGGVMIGLDPTLGLNAPIMPMAYDINHWNEFIKSGKNDENKIETDASGNPQLTVYSKIRDTGNFGQLAMDDEHAGSSEIRDWINYGVPVADYQNLLDRNLLPVTSHDPNTWDWVGNPGFHSTVVQEVNAFAGQTFVMPLFTPYNANKNDYQAGVGSGSHYDYNIAGFVGVKVMATNQSNRDIVIQPAAPVVINATFDPSTYGPIGTYTPPNNLVTVFHPAKLTN